MWVAMVWRAGERLSSVLSGHGGRTPDKPRYPIESDDHSMLAPQRERWSAKPPCIPLGAERSLLRVLAHHQASGGV